MEHAVWNAVAMLYGLVPLTVFGGVLYYAHYHARGWKIRIPLYMFGGLGAAVCLGWLIYATV